MHYFFLSFIAIYSISMGAKADPVVVPIPAYPGLLSNSKPGADAEIASSAISIKPERETKSVSDSVASRDDLRLEQNIHDRIAASISVARVQKELVIRVRDGEVLVKGPSVTPLEHDRILTVLHVFVSPERVSDKLVVDTNASSALK